MAMALKADVASACRMAGTEKPIDLVHLSNQTMGDRELEQEILQIFARQISGYIDQVRNCGSKAECKRVAHMLKGAARSIGAFHLAELAASSETLGDIDKTALVCEMENIRSYIENLESCN